MSIKKEIKLKEKIFENKYLIFFKILRTNNIKYTIDLENNFVYLLKKSNKIKFFIRRNKIKEIEIPNIELLERKLIITKNQFKKIYFNQIKTKKITYYDVDIKINDNSNLEELKFKNQGSFMLNIENNINLKTIEFLEKVQIFELNISKTSITKLSNNITFIQSLYSYDNYLKELPILSNKKICLYTNWKKIPIFLSDLFNQNKIQKITLDETLKIPLDKERNIYAINYDVGFNVLYQDCFYNLKEMYYKIYILKNGIITKYFDKNNSKDKEKNKKKISYDYYKKITNKFFNNLKTPILHRKIYYKEFNLINKEDMKDLYLKDKYNHSLIYYCTDITSFEKIIKLGYSLKDEEINEVKNYKIRSLFEYNLLLQKTKNNIFSI